MGGTKRRGKRNGMVRTRSKNNGGNEKKKKKWYSKLSTKKWKIP